MTICNRLRGNFFLFWVASAAAVSLASAHAAEPKLPPRPAAASPEAEVRATAAAFAKAFDRGDAAAVAALWTADGTAADADGTIYKGRAAIEQQYAQLFKEHAGARIVVTVKSVEFPAADVAIEDGLSQVVGQHAGAPQYSRYTAVHVRQEGKWPVASVRESEVELPSNYSKIESLGGLVGTWTAERDGRRVRTTVRWIANNSFLEREYEISDDHIVTSGGRQIIGWDPKAGKIRSWSFDASGGYGTGVWSETPEGWQIEQSGVTVDGTPTVSRDLLIRVPGDDNVLGWRSVGRMLGERHLPDSPEVVLDRVSTGGKPR